MSLRNRISTATGRLESTVTQFWLAPASTAPMAALRIGVAAVLLYQALCWSGDCMTLFGPEGLVSWNALKSSPAFVLDVHGPFHLSLLAEWFAPAGVSPDVVVGGVFCVYLTAVFGLLFGYLTRVCAATACLTNLLLTSTGVATTYGVDQFARITLFYCVCFPVGLSLSVDARRRGRSMSQSVTARIGLRTIQLHMALMYLATGIHKASGPQWWNGEAIWRAITLPQLATVDMTWLSGWPTLLIMAGWWTLAIEIGYVIFAWHRSTRLFVVGSIIAMHVGIAVFMGLVSFAMIMIALNVAAFLVPSEPQKGSLPQTNEAGVSLASGGVA